MQTKVILFGALVLICACSPEPTPPPRGPTPPSSVSTEVIRLSEENFQEQVLHSAKPVMIDVSATWCQPCKRMKPIVAQLAAEFGGQVVFGELDGDENRHFMKEYAVKGYPSFLFFKNGKLVTFMQEGRPVDRFLGETPKEELAAQLRALVE
jgi:thioredoxin 1